MRQIIQINGHGLYAPAINARSLVVDLGANLGRFSDEVRTQFGCTPVMVEANPDLALKLQQDSGAQVLNAAISGRDGVASFNVSVNPEASSLFELPEKSPYNAVLERRVEVREMSLDSLLKTFEPRPVDVLKMDIEGAEVAALESVSDGALKSIGQLTVEFHDDATFGFDLKKGVDSTIDRLETLGFASLQFNRPARTNALFLGPSLELSAMKIAALRFRFDYARALFHASTQWLARN